MKIVGRTSSSIMDHRGFPFPVSKNKDCGVCEMQKNKGIQSAEEERVTGDLHYGSHKILPQHIFSHNSINHFFPTDICFFCKGKMNLICTVTAINIDF